MAENLDAGQSLSFTLTADEALVLFDFLSRITDDEKTAGLRRLIEDDAEIWALNNILCQLEHTVAVSFAGDYRTLVSVARSRVAETNGGRWPWRQAD